MKIIRSDKSQVSQFLKDMKQRAGAINLSTNEVVMEIIQAVKTEGDAAVRRFAMKFDGAAPTQFEMNKEEMKQAYDEASDELKKALLHAKENITLYHEKQLKQGYEIQKDQGVVLGQIVRGLSRVGLYVPGGTAAYPSTVLMNGIPAKIAGVKEVIMITPPIIEGKGTKQAVCKANPDILAAAYLAGVDRVFLAGGAQAVAALTYGTECFPVVDKIVGPGNIYVATAKKLLFGQVDIDMIAGPSEILVIADETANAKFVAADLLSQAEHDPMASSVLLTTSETLAEETEKELELQQRKLSRKSIIEKSLADFGAIIICRDMDEMIEIANEIAPEHLELMVKNPMELLPSIENAGSVFCGEYAPEPLGDYLSGTNHVLPTSGTARFSSPLGVDSFMKKMSYTFYTKEALEKDQTDIVTIANREGLDAHANSIKVRFEA